MGGTKLLGMTMACGRSLESQSSIAKSVNTHLSIAGGSGARQFRRPFLPESANLHLSAAGGNGA